MKQSYNQMLNSMPSITYYAIENNKPYTYAIHVILHFPPLLVRKVRLLMEILHRDKASPPAPLRRERGVISHGNGGIGFGVIWGW